MSGLPALVPCTPVACLKLIKSVHPSIAGMDALMIGRSHIVGNPMSQVLLYENATVTLAHTHTRHLPDLCRRAELLCVAIGCAEFIRGGWIKPGATVIDVGINRVVVDGKSRIVGDVKFAEAVKVAGAITPVPGGVGPMTIVCLLVNTLRAACMQARLPPPAV
jgi:methylenetetrahydrofolate dehydrogenase (NADP+)/methenyltetrahydrofolate cyclohydrolase